MGHVMGQSLSPHRLFGAFVAIGLCLATGCQRDGGADLAMANDNAGDDGDDEDANGSDEEQLSYLVTCAAELDAVAHLPAIDTEQDVVDEKASTDDVADEHAGLAATYRAQARTLAASLGQSDADLAALYKQAEQRIDEQRKTRRGDEFAIWVTGEADDCPPL